MVEGSGTTDDDNALPPLKPLLPKSDLPLPKPAAATLLEILLLSIVTAPLSAMALPPSMSEELVRLMLSLARIFPANFVLVPRVADPVPDPPVTPISQYMPLSVPPLSTLTEEALPVVSAVPTLKTKFALGLPLKSRVSAPFNPAVVSKE